MQNRLFMIISLFLILVVFNSCDPATGLYITNRLNHDIYIEYEFNDIDIALNEYYRINNNIDIKAGESQSLIHIFPGTSIIEHLGFGPVNSIEDIIEAIDLIFKNIDVYKINNDEKIKIYDKNYFLDTKNIRRHKYPVSYSIEYIIS